MSKKSTCEELEQKVRDLEQAEALHKRAEDQLRVKAAQIQARNKELNCLFRISETLRRSENRSLAETLCEIIAFIPQAWQYPDLACARITLDGKVLSTDNFEETEWKLPRDIMTDEKRVGSLTVCYLKKPPETDDGPFLETEKNLLDSLAERIGRIIERKRAKTALQDSEKKFRSMMEAFVDPLYICSSDFVVQYMNPAMIRRICRDATGEKCHQAMHGLDTKCRWCIFDKLTNHETMEIEVKSPLDNRVFRIANMPIHNPDGTTSKMSVFRDITDYVQAIEDKEKAQADLAQAQKMETIGNLAGGIAHDFNNILTSIIGFTELALDDVEKDSVIEESLQEVYTAGKRAKALVEQILAVARQADEPTQPIQMDIIVKEALKFIRSSTPSTIELQQNLESSAFIMANPSQIHQIILNLCTNAAYAMDTSGGVLRIALTDMTIDHRSHLFQEGLAPGAYIEMTVSDTGPGIPSEILGLIFEPYFTTKTMGEGTGLGLSVVQGIVEKSGGKIIVESQVNKGTTFRVFLPATTVRQAESQQESEILPKGTERILFVDDEAVLAKLGVQIIGSLGYSVTALTDSVEALELFKARPDDFDLVITDMTMPKMTGDVLAAELMAIRPDIPIIMCTGYNRKISSLTVKEIGIKALAYKPIIKADLAKTVRGVLDAESISVNDKDRAKTNGKYR